MLEKSCIIRFTFFTSSPHPAVLGFPGLTAVATKGNAKPTHDLTTAFGVGPASHFYYFSKMK